MDAVLTIEDTRFFEHNGVDYKGMARASCWQSGAQIERPQMPFTVARNVYLSSTYTRKDL